MRSVVYLDGNRRLFDDGLAAIPGVRSMALEATYLAWVDFAGTGMAPDEFTARVEKQARIAANHGPSFGTGGESFLRFNIATPRARRGRGGGAPAAGLRRSAVAGRSGPSRRGWSAPSVKGSSGRDCHLASPNRFTFPYRSVLGDRVWPEAGRLTAR